MIIEIREIPQEGKRFEGEEPVSILDMDSEKHLRLKDPLHYDLTANVISDDLLVKGTLSIDASFRCSRCAEFFPLRVSAPSFECVRDLTEPRSARTTGDKQIESVDLTANIREAMLLAFPSYPVCSRDCKGLCPQCGTDLNKDLCNCKPPADLRWSALDKLSS